MSRTASALASWAINDGGIFELGHQNGKAIGNLFRKFPKRQQPVQANRHKSIEIVCQVHPEFVGSVQYPLATSWDTSEMGKKRKEVGQTKKT